ncbi:MAG: thiopurine S-methyltransferase [Vulcanimicrobiota bacterium]
MQHDFWHSRWENREIGFHEGRPNTLLVQHFPRLGLGADARIFVPLCGKTRDIGWLLNQGCRVAGAELNAGAVEELFEELELEPRVQKLGSLRHYAAKELEVFVGDIFELSAGLLGPVQAIYDRAALVALPPEMRARYTGHLVSVTSAAPQLLIHFPYDQSLLEGPPFSVSEDEIQNHYGLHYEVTLLESRNIDGGLKGRVEALEQIRLLTPSCAK